MRIETRMLAVALAALAWLPSASAAPRPRASGGELTLPSGVADAGTIDLRVVDRNGVPLSAARVRAVFQGSGAAQSLTAPDGASAAEVALEPVLTDVDGHAVLRPPDGAGAGWLTASIERPGFAPGAFRPLFAGRAYELALEFGAAFVVACKNEDGTPVPAEIVVEHQRFPELPREAVPLRRLSTNRHGTARIDYVPCGTSVVHARSADGSYAVVRVQVGSAWRSNSMVFEPPVELVLRPARERLIPVADEAGAAVDGLRAALDARDPTGWTTVEVAPGGVLVRGVPSPSPEGSLEPAFGAAVRVWADGWRFVALSCLGDEPPSAWTSPMPMARGLALPTPPAAEVGDGELWLDLDPHGSSPWEPRAALVDAPATLDVPAGFAIVGAAVRAGRVAAWLRADEAPSGTTLRWEEPGAIGASFTIDGHPYRCGLVRFELVSPALGAPLPGGFTGKTFAFTDPDGVVQLDGLFPGRWRVAFSTHLVSSVGMDAFADVGPGELCAFTLDATRGRDVGGLIVDAAGAPIPRGRVTVFGIDDRAVTEGEAPVGADGEFLLTGLTPGGRYLLRWEEVPYTQPGSFGPETDLTPEGRTAELELDGDVPSAVVLVGDEPR